MTPEQVAILASSIAALIGAVAAVASAIFAGVAVRAQRRAQHPHVTVRHSTLMPVFGGVGRYLEGSTLGDPWFAIVVHNDGVLPVTVKSAALVFMNGDSAPFMRPPFPGADELGKEVAAGDDATFWVDELPKVAEVHAAHGGAKWVTATIGGGLAFHGPRINRKWLDGWVKRPPA